MKRNDLVTMATVALITATLTVAAFWAAPLEAGGDAQGLTPKIAQPKLSAKGMEVTLSPVSGTEKPGDQPVFELTAQNTADRPSELNVRLLMTAMSPADALSRVIRIPNKLWQDEQTITLGPGEKKTVRVDTRTKLPAKNLISVTLSQALPPASMAVGPQAGPSIQILNTPQPGIAVLNFSTSGPEPTLASAIPHD